MYWSYVEMNEYTACLKKKTLGGKRKLTVKLINKLIVLSRYKEKSQFHRKNEQCKLATILHKILIDEKSA